MLPRGSHTRPESTSKKVARPPPPPKKKKKKKKKQTNNNNNNLGTCLLIDWEITWVNPRVVIQDHASIDHKTRNSVTGRGGASEFGLRFSSFRVEVFSHRTGLQIVQVGALAV